jgi:signal transduction histidine kinase
METLLQKGHASNKEFRVYSRDGQPVDVILNAVGIKKENGSFTQIVGIIHDMTSRKHLEQQIQKDEKLRSISVLASGIAHDFNNFLTIILGSADLLQVLAEDKSNLRPHIENIQTAGMRARDLTQQLLSFAKGGVPDIKTGSIGDLVRESAAFVLAGSSVRCETEVPVDLWQVEMDASQISQVLNNLIINAIQAMPQGGNLKITAANVTVTEEDSILLRSGDYVKISVIDQGIGIPPENLNKIFDPFFTTKKTGNGLGLANAYTIVKNHRGLITAQSQVGFGSTFDIYLPATDRIDI